MTQRKKVENTPHGLETITGGQCELLEALSKGSIPDAFMSDAARADGQRLVLMGLAYEDDGRFHAQAVGKLTVEALQMDPVEVQRRVDEIAGYMNHDEETAAGLERELHQLVLRAWLLRGKTANMVTATNLALSTTAMVFRRG